MNENKPIRLNLGRGSKYLEGYINIDGPTSELSDPNIRADMYVDINELSYPNESIDEIYMEAVFEHFPRHQAILNLRACVRSIDCSNYERDKRYPVTRYGGIGGLGYWGERLMITKVFPPLPHYSITPTPE